MKEYISISPLKVLEASSRKVLGPGNLGVLLARAGAGKTACLIHIALDMIFRQKKLVHVSLEEGPDKIMSYYNVMYAELLQALNMADDHEYRARIDSDRMILAYLNKSFETERLRASLRNLKSELDFIPNALIVDGLDFETVERSIFEEFKGIAQESEAEIWFSALSHRHITHVNERGIPYPCHKIDDIFSIIMQLRPKPSGIFLNLLKDHDNPSLTEISIKLDSSTFIAVD